MNAILKTILVGAALLSAAIPTRADTVRLKTGAILVGDVELAENGDIVINVRFPEEEQITLKRDELEPRSLYDVLDRRTDSGDVGARLRLGQLAESVGLYGIAVSDYLAVAALDPELRSDMEKRVERVRESIAAKILQDAKALLEEGNTRSALMYIHTIQERYGTTEAAKEAKKLMATAHEHAGSSTEVAKKTVTEEKAPEVIESLKKDLEKGDRETRELGGHEGNSSRDRRAAEKAIRYYESAWEKIKTLPVAAQDTELHDKIRRLRESGKDRLTKAYLSAGSIHLQAYSLPRAEEYCNKACELQPEDKASHVLHRLIIEAKINGGYGWIGR
jgi:tetratricopeptide (TPR) repeat protein